MTWINRQRGDQPYCINNQDYCNFIQPPGDEFSLYFILALP
ncbi:hypothetical protein KP13_31780 [Klebsiella pneumoniae subsp. pneumoniae Kp13]|nr:hypothetical protein KP13_31780 [Klebsiella pneumoniae subsp. pneumoniae Kp13]